VTAFDMATVVAPSSLSRALIRIPNRVLAATTWSITPLAADVFLRSSIISSFCYQFLPEIP
jgi:hypothetical protein